MKKQTTLILFFTFIFSSIFYLNAEEKNISAEDFLERVRHPFMQATFWEFSGDLQTYKKKNGRRKESIQLELTYNINAMYSALLIGEQDLYLVKQENHYQDKEKKPEMTLTMPEKIKTISMQEAGIEPEDVTFAFIYWDLLYDFKFEKIKGQQCRVLELKHPRSDNRVIAWFSVNYGFPLQVYYYKNEESNPWRILEFKDFKEYRKDFWFVKTMLIRDPQENWRTQLTFKNAEMKELPTNQALPKLPQNIKAKSVEDKK